MAPSIKITAQGDPRQMMLDEIVAAENATSAGLRAAGDGLKAAWRGQVTAAGLGTRLANAIRSKHYPSGRTTSINAASLVYGRPHAKRSNVIAEDRDASAATILHSYNEGSVIVASRRKFLAIPLPASGGFLGMGLRQTAHDGSIHEGSRSRRRRMSPERFERRTGRKLRFVPRPGKHALLVLDNAKLNKAGVVPARKTLAAPRTKPRKGDMTIPMFVLVPIVRIPKKLDFARDTRLWGDRLPSLILQHWKDV